MISYLKGNVHHISGSYVVLLVQDVGYDIEMSHRDLGAIVQGAQISLWTHQIIREDAQDLYGFLGLKARDTFRLMLKAHQVGPKLALAIMDIFTPADLAHIAFQGSVDALTRVKGMGPKLAHRLMIDLKSWVDKGLLDPTEGHIASVSIPHDALMALVHLGYKEHVVKKVLHTLPPDQDTQALIKQALQLLASSRNI